MKETKNYGLLLPELADYIDIADFNHNFNLIEGELIQKLNMSALTFEKDGKTYIAKFAMVDGRPKVIGVEVGSIVTDSGIEYTKPTDASNTIAGRVKVSSVDDEEKPYTVPTMGKLEELTKGLSGGSGSKEFTLYGIKYTGEVIVTEEGLMYDAKPKDMTPDLWKLVEWDKAVNDVGFITSIAEDTGEEFEQLLTNESAFKLLADNNKSIRAITEKPNAFKKMVEDYSRIGVLYSSKYNGYTKGVPKMGEFLPLGASEDGDSCRAFNGTWTAIGTSLGSWLLDNLDNPIATQVMPSKEGLIYYYDLGRNDDEV